MTECFWNHESMVGVTEDCDEAADFAQITLWAMRFGGAFDAHEASFLSVANPEVSPAAGPTGDIAVVGYFEVDLEDYIGAGVYAACVSPGSASPGEPIELTTPLPAPVSVTDTAFAWDAGNDRWTLTVDAAFIGGLAGFGSEGLFVVVVDGTEHVARLKFGGIA